MHSGYFAIISLVLSFVCHNSSFGQEVVPKSFRVISLAPVITEIISELGKEDLLVGKTKFCEIKNKNLKVPSLGGYLDISIEGVYSLKPDLVILLPEQEELVLKFAKFKIKSMVVSNRSINDINNAIFKIAQTFGSEEVAKKIVAEKKSIVADSAKRCVDINKKPAKTLFIFDEEIGDQAKFYAAGQSTFYTEVMKVGNYINAIHQEKDYIELSYEGILALKPEQIFLVTENKRPDLIKDRLVKYTKIDKQAIKILPKKPILFPGPRYPEIINSFICSTS